MIKFIKCTAAQYEAATKNADNFYYLTDTNRFFLGTIELSDQDLSNYLTEVVAKNNSIAITNDNEIAVKISSKTGNALTLSNVAGEEGLLVEVPAPTDYTVTVTESTPEGYAKAYTIAQAATGLSATINIPKDMVVSSGRVVTNPAGQPEGTYLELTLANATSDKVYINVSDLIEYVTAGADTATIHVNIDSNHQVTANVIDGSIGTTQLTNGAVTTDKIGAKAVTSAKLSDEVNASLANADSALQASDIATGSANGTISVDGDDVAVKGLGSAAYTNSTAYATAAQGEKADSAVQSVATGTTNGTISVDNTEVSVAGLKSAAYTESSAYATAAQGALADSAVQTVETGTTNGTIKVDGSAVSVYGLDSAAYAATTDFDAAGSANAAKNEVIGASTDAASANTIYGAKAYAASILEWETMA